ncbi:MAG: leucine-rich repeat domain-containing protein [Lachnospiraceae bacterium]
MTEINDHAFYRCKSLDTIQFPEHLRRIGGQAFYFCGFPSIALPDSLEILEESAFFKCTQLTYVRIPKNVRFIGKWAFHGCNRLQYLEIRHDPDFIGEWIINRSATIRCYQGSKVDQYCQASGFKTEYL